MSEQAGGICFSSVKNFLKLRNIDSDSIIRQLMVPKEFSEFSLHDDIAL